MATGDLRVCHGGTWKTPLDAWVRQDGQWVKVREIHFRYDQRSPTVTEPSTPLWLRGGAYEPPAQVPETTEATLANTPEVDDGLMRVAARTNPYGWSYAVRLYRSSDPGVNGGFAHVDTLEMEQGATRMFAGQTGYFYRFDVAYRNGYGQGASSGPSTGVRML